MKMDCNAPLNRILHYKKLKQRGLIKESLNTLEIGGVVRLVRRVIGGTFLFEMSGAFILTLRFLKDMDVLHAIYYGIFHSISAFCNAGFDLMGRYSPFWSAEHSGGNAARVP